MTRKLTFLILALFALISGPGWGQNTATATLTTGDYTWTCTNHVTSQIVNGITFSFSGGSTDPTYYADGLRTYEGCNITISSENTISEIVFTYTISNSGCLKNPTVGTWDNSTKTWTGNANSIGLTVGHSSGTKNGQVKITQIVVTYSAGDTPSITVNPSTITWDNKPINEELSETISVSQANLTDDITISSNIGTVTPSTIAVGGEETDVTFTYTPTTTGDFEGTITFTSGETTETVTVSGSAYDPSQITTYEKVTSADDLVAGASYILVCPTKNKAAGAMGANAYFSSEDATLSDNNTATSQNAIELVLGGTTGAWTFTTSEGLIGTTAAKSLNHTGTETTTWTIVITSDEATITSTNTSYGSIKYNASSPRFLNYASGQTAVALYKKVNSSSVATPTFTPAGGIYTTAQNVTITCATEGASIRYTTNGDEPTSSSTLYENPIPVSTTTTVKAIAYVGDEASNVATATYTILTPLTTMDEIFAAATEAGSIATDILVTFDDWVISGVKNDNAYLTDGTKGLIIYESGHGFEVGDILTGTVSCKVQLYQGSAELIALTSESEGLTVTKDGSVYPVTMTIDQITSGVYTGAVITIENVTYNSSDELLSDGTNTIKPYNKLYSDMLFTNDKEYNVTGVYLQYNDTKEIMPRKAEDIYLIPATEYNIELIQPLLGGGTISADKDKAAAAVNWIVGL